jgi:signal transduction histidine kinase
VIRHPVQWLKDRPTLADAMLAALLAAISVGGLLTVGEETASASNRDPDWFAFVGIAVLCGTVAIRRLRPLVALWVSVAAVIPYWVLDYVDSGSSVPVLLNLYTVAAHVDRPRSLRHGILASIPLIVVMIVGVIAEEEDLPPVAVVGNAVIFATAWLIGDTFRNRRAYLAEVEARAEQAERDREAAADRAVQDERTRIARELHDVVAHSVSVMVVQAGAARRVIDRHPEQTVESLSIIESTGRNALDELRRVLGVLRSGESVAATEPQPTADDVASLVHRWRDAGHSVALTVHGTPPTLPLGVSLTVYRIVQEALTNVMKHAGPATHTDVCLRYGPEEVTLEVIDDGRGPGGEPVPSSGQGLIGMRERVEVFGGTLSTGPRPGGGYRVHASLPVTTTIPT